MKLNNKGFAISTIMYLILVFAVILITATLFILSSRKLVVDNQKNKVLNDIYNIVCSKVTFSTASKKTDGSLIGNIPVGNFLPGDEYTCQVNGERVYHFFVLSTDKDNVNLILDRTITSSGLLSTSRENSIVAYLSTSDGSSESDGPVTLLNFLNSATKSWTNIPNINMNYIYSDDLKIITNETTVEIVKNNQTQSVFNNLKVRVPYESEIESVGCTEEIKSCPFWLSNYLMNNESVTGGTNISGLVGYWILPKPSEGAKIIDSYGSLKAATYYGGINNSVIIGVRPVITLSKSKFVN